MAQSSIRRRKKQSTRSPKSLSCKDFWRVENEDENKGWGVIRRVRDALFQKQCTERRSLRGASREHYRRPEQTETPCNKNLESRAVSVSTSTGCCSEERVFRSTVHPEVRELAIYH